MILYLNSPQPSHIPLLLRSKQELQDEEISENLSQLLAPGENPAQYEDYAGWRIPGTAHHAHGTEHTEQRGAHYAHGTEHIEQKDAHHVHDTEHTEHSALDTILLCLYNEDRFLR